MQKSNQDRLFDMLTCRSTVTTNPKHPASKTFFFLAFALKTTRLVLSVHLKELFL